MSKKGIDWSKKGIYDGIGRPDLRPQKETEQDVLDKMIIVEYVDEYWTFNYNKFNHKTDIVIPKELAKILLALKK